MTPSKDKLLADGVRQIEDVFIFALTHWEQLREPGIWTGAYIIWITGDFIGFIGMYLGSWVKKQSTEWPATLAGVKHSCSVILNSIHFKHNTEN